MKSPFAFSEERPFTGRHMLIAMLCFFGVIITVNLTMATFASQSWTGLVVRNSYVASQQYNERLAASREQAAREWQATIGYRDGGIAFTLTDKDGAPVHLQEARAEIGRPAYEALDHEVPLTYRSDGLYWAKDPLGPGIWQVAVTGSHEAGPYRLEARITVRSDEAAPGASAPAGTVKP